MDIQVQRVVEWREQKRKEGYRPLTVWLKADVKHLIEDLAAERREDLAQVITVAIQALKAGAPKSPDYVDAPTVRRLVHEYVQDLTAGRLTPAAAPDVPLPTPRLPEEKSTVVLRGEYGWVVQAVRTAAGELGRFTCQQMAKHIDYSTDNVHSTLKHLISRGELSKKGRVYFLVGGSPRVAP